VTRGNTDSFYFGLKKAAKAFHLYVFVIIISANFVDHVVGFGRSRLEVC